MALSNRLSLAGTDVNGIFYKVEIKYTGSTSITGKFALPMFKITNRPKDESINNWLITSKCEIYLYEDSDDISNFLSELIDYQQLDYYVYISTSVDDSTYTPYWRGIILQDQIQKEEASRPFVIKLTATDGISMLKDIEYPTGNTITTGIPRTKINDLLRQALLFGLDPLLWADNDVYFITTINWWEANQIYGATRDPLESLYLDAAIYPIIEQVFSNNVVTGYKSCYYVLEELLKVMGARIYMADGAYYIEQVSERANANSKRVKYDKSGTELSAGLIPSQIVMDETRGKARFAGNVYSFFPAIKKVIAKQNFYPYRGLDIFQFYSKTNMNADAVITKDWGVFDKDVDFSGSTAPNFLGLDVEFEMVIEWNSRGAKTNIIWWYDIEVRIELDDINSATNYYWNDDTGVWDTSSVAFKFRSRPSGIINTGGVATSVTHNIPFSKSITTASLPATGRIIIRMGLVDVYFRQSNGVGGHQLINMSTFATGGGITFRLNEFSDSGGGFVNNEALNTNPNVGDEYIVDLGDLALGTGSKTTGNILSYDGTDIQKAINWDRANGSSNLSLGGLLVSERLRIQSEVLKVYDGVIQYPNGFAFSVLFNSERYLPISYSFNAYKGEVNGRYFLIGRDGLLTVDVDLGKGLLKNSFSGNNNFNKGNFIGNVLNAGDVIGYHRYEASETLTLNLSHMTSGQKNNGVEVDASDGATDYVSVTDTVVLLTWGGGNGSFTLELPSAAAMVGQRLEIILDSTFDSGKSVVITPESGLIRGESELMLVSPEVKLQLRSIGGQWH